MRNFIENHFSVAKNDTGETVFKSTENPESWTDLELFLSVFDNCQPIFESLMEKVSETGFGYIFADWKERGLI